MVMVAFSKIAKVVAIMSDTAKQIAQNYKSGAITLEEVDPPALKSGHVLVRNHYSVISLGTEGMKLREGKMNLLQKAKARPDQVKQVINTAKQQGLKATYQKVMNRLDSLTPLGYSCSGVVEAVGGGVTEYTVGQKVACAGAGVANHADYNMVPVNLVVPVPDTVDMQNAAFTTMGSIAMHGFRQGECTLGETVVVIGLGLVGQLLTQIAVASGVTVIGIDLSESRCERAIASGAYASGRPDDERITEQLMRLTQSHGADCVFLTVGSDSNEPLEQALELVRDRGRIVCVGKTRMDLPYNESFKKEVEFRFSRSYGPGRYDPHYEDKGIDYPIGYVRWTEGRNLQAFMQLLAHNKLNMGAIIDQVYPFAEADRIYEKIHAGEVSGLGLLFEYDKAASLKHIKPKLTQVTAPQDAVAIGCIGAGNYASSMLLPHLKQHKDAYLAHVATATSLSCKNAANKFNFAAHSTDYKQILRDEQINAVLIATRHASHARFAAQALEAGKAVFVEKPLAIDNAGLEQVVQAAGSSGNHQLMVGFNRRFSPIIQQLKASLPDDSPLTLQYRVHAGALPADAWINDKDQGGRFVGEAGHFLDVFAYLTGSRPVSVYATAIRAEQATHDDADNMSVIVNYADGSVATLHYLTQGGSKTPKETLEVIGGGVTAHMLNFETLTLYRGDKKAKTHGGFKNDKGQQQEMQAWVASIKQGQPMPIDFDCLIDTSRLTLLAVESLTRGEKVTM